MSDALATAHMTGQERLRALASRGVTAIWASLPAYDEENVDEWLTRVLPLIAAAQRQSVALTEAYLARSLERQPIGVDIDTLTGAAARNGTPPEQVYRRPFVTVWTALGNGTDWRDAVASGRNRATSMAATDVQLSQRATLQAVQAADPRIRGYRRVADASACKFCVTVNGAFVKSAAAMPLHAHCGCTLAPIDSPVTPTAVPDAVAVHEHGELGPVLTDPAHDFTSESDI